MVKMRKFVTYLDGQNLTIGQMEDGILFIQHHFKLDCNVHDRPAMTTCVRSDAIIDSIINQKRKAKARRIVDDGADIQAKLDVRISDEQMDGLVEECFAPTDPAIGQMHELSRLQTVSGIRHTQTTGQRGQDLRGYTSSMAFTCRVRAIGPGRGTNVDFAITNDGKVNKEGKITYTALAPHVNPLWDPSGLQGLCLFYRHSIMMEPFPNHVNYIDFQDHPEDDFAKRPVYREIKDYNAHLDKNTMNDQWKAFYASQNIFSDKVTHQGRRQVQQELCDDGISQDKIGRFCHYSEGGGRKGGNQKQAKHYLTNPPVDATVSRSGGDRNHPKQHDPAYNNCGRVSGALDAVMKKGAPYVGLECDKVKIEEDLTPNYKNREEKRLIMARGSVDAYKHKIERAFLLAAARRVDMDGRLIPDSQPNYLRFQPSISLFRHPVFQSDEFLRLVAEMRKIEDDALSHHVEISETAMNEVERVIKNEVSTQLSCLSSNVQKILTRQDRQDGAMKQNDQTQHQLVEGLYQLAQNQQTLMNYLASPNSGAANHSLTPTLPPFQLGLPQPHSIPWRGVPQVSIMGSVGTGNQPGDNGITDNVTLGLKADGCTPRKRKRAIPRHHDYGDGRVLMSTENKSLDDFWFEFAHGRNGNRALRDLEAVSMDWRRDPPKSSKFKTFWGYRSPIYNLITHYMEKEKLNEVEALNKARPLFESVTKTRNGKPNMPILSKLFKDKLIELGGYDNRRWKQSKR
jgi:hypothetical protein